MNVERKGSRFRQTKGRKEVGFRFFGAFQRDLDCQLDLHRGLRSELEADGGHIVAGWDSYFIRSRNKPFLCDPIAVKDAPYEMVTA